MTIQIPGGLIEAGTNANPGLNTLAQAYQQNTQTLGPALMQRQAQMAMAKGYQDIAKASGAAATQGAVTQRAADYFEKTGGMQAAIQRAAFRNAGIQPGENPYSAKLKLMRYSLQPQEVRAAHAQQEAAMMMEEATKNVLGMMGDISQSGIPTQLPFEGIQPGAQPNPIQLAAQMGAPQPFGNSLLPMGMGGIAGAVPSAFNAMMR